MHLVVTGGAGFIGSTLVDLLLDSGHRVDVIDNLSTGSRENLTRAFATHRESVALHVVDIRDANVTDLIVELAPEVVIHLAAQVDVRLSVADPVADAMTNVIGTIRVLEGARLAHSRKVLFTSSGGAVHGSLRDGEPPASETAPQRPESPYGVSKLVMLDYLALYRQLYGLDYTALALANVYGPRQDPYGEGGVVAIFGSRLLGDKDCTIFGDGEQTRDFVFVKDVARAFEAALTAGSGVYNIGTGVETSVNELYRVMAHAAGTDRAARSAPGRPGEAQRSCLDGSLAARELGWRPVTPLPEGVAETLAYLGQLG